MKNQHTHKYTRVEFKKSKTIIYRCAIEGCTHYIHEPLIVGRFCLCYRCEKPFVITPKTLRAKRLHCEDCNRGKHNKIRIKEVIEDSNKTLDNILTELNMQNDIELKDQLEGQGD